MLFGLLLLEEGVEAAAEPFAVVVWTVVLSVLLHGATAARGARDYGEWWAPMTDAEKKAMPEGLDLGDVDI